ncbi:MAG: DUF6569 family protein [Kofleriaceae bacterium]
MPVAPPPPPTPGMELHNVVAIAILVGCNAAAVPEPVPEPAPHEPFTPVPHAVEPTATPDLAFGVGFELRRPIHDGRLTLVPIVTTSTRPERTFITLHQGMAQGLVGVREGGATEAVTVSNRSDQTLVILGGEIIIEGHQDRVIARKAVIPPNTSQSIAVWCAELGRASGPESFRHSGAIAELSLRRALRGDQFVVWSLIDVINAREGLHPDTGTYRHAAAKHTNAANLARRDRITAQLEALEERDRIVGVAVAVDGRVVAIDRFATAALYRELEPLLLASYLPTTTGTAKPTPRIGPADVRAFSGSAPAVNDAASILR